PGSIPCATSSASEPVRLLGGPGDPTGPAFDRRARRPWTDAHRHGTSPGMRSLALVLLLSGVLVPSPCWADDACLTGDSTLGDQRSPAARAAPTDAACPCAEAASARSYQRCARHSLRYAVPFIEHYLGGEASVTPLLGPPTGPGFVYQAAL